MVLRYSYKMEKEGEHAQIVATDARGEVGWFEVLRSRGGNVLHAPLKGEPVVERAFGTNVMTEPEVRRKGRRHGAFSSSRRNRQGVGPPRISVDVREAPQVVLQFI